MDSPLRQLKPKQGKPRLWIERVWLYAEVSPPREIREIELNPGINVVWAREREPALEEDFSAYGHGVGKTSFCRLLRYCLGEDSFGDPEHENRVRAAFPGGAVVALIHLAGECWSVLRPFGEHRTSHAIQGNQPEILLSGRADQNPYGNFRGRLESELLRNLPAELPGSRTPVRWAHLLGWCTRDQEAHLSAFTAWRGGESVNATAGFRRPAQDPPNLVRAVLGLLEQEETELLNEQNRLQKALEEVKQEIGDLEKEPQYWHHELQRRLKRRLNLDDETPVRSSDLFGVSLTNAIQQRLTSLAEREIVLRKELETIDRDLGPVYEERQSLIGEVDSYNSILDFLGREATEVQSEIDRPRKEREELLSKRGVCQLGWIDFQRCCHILDRLNIPNLRDPQDIQEAKNRLTGLVGNASMIRSKLGACEEKLKRVKDEIAVREDKRREANLKLATSRLEQQSLQEDWSSLIEYDDVVEGKRGSATLEDARTKARDLEGKVRTTNERLSLQKLQRSEAEQRLEKLWTACLRGVIGKNGYGKFSPEDGNRPFRLLSHSGRAIRALEVLLGDWVSLLHSVAGEGNLPGFLLHDCPREADMSPGLYRNFLNALAEWQEILANQGEVPFQYILTTTSPPPERFQRPDTLRLELSPESEDGLLFKTRLGPEIFI